MSDPLFDSVSEYEKSHQKPVDNVYCIGEDVYNGKEIEEGALKDVCQTLNLERQILGHWILGLLTLGMVVRGLFCRETG